MADPNVDERSTQVVMSTLNNSTRVFKNEVSDRIIATEAEAEPDFAKIAPLVTGKLTKSMWQENGDTQSAMWSCGQSVGLITDIPTCKELMQRMVAEAEERLSVGASLIKSRL